jgi:hypothetical protein
VRPSGFLLSLLVCVSTFAQTAGDLIWQAGSVVLSGPYTYIDTDRPITEDGTVDTVVLSYLTAAPCTDQIKIRFFRPGTKGIAGSLDLVGAAGPFAASNGINTVTFSPISVKKGDWLAVTQIKANCGGTSFSTTLPHATLYELPSDFNGGTIPNLFARKGTVLNAAASKGALRLVGTLPVVGSASGNFGSFFRTGLTVLNSSVHDVTIKLVYRPAGASSSPGDPSTQFTLASRATRNYNDVVQSMGLTGLGSLDIYSNSYTPATIARIFNDAGAAGTSGFTEEPITDSMALTTGQHVVVAIPADLTNFRLNIGTRTFGATTVSVSFYDAGGGFIGHGTTKTYAANYFEQVAVSALAAGTAIPAGGSIRIFVDSGGPVVFYSATTDNRTNDGSLKIYTIK